MIRARRVFIATLLSGLLASTGASAESDWDWTLGLYLFASDVGIDMSVDGDPILGVDIAFSDLLDRLEMAGSAHFEGQRGHWGFMTDLFYVSIGDSFEVPLPDPLPGAVAARMDLAMIIFEAGALYSPSASTEGFALFAGIRVMDIDQLLVLSFPLPTEPVLEVGIEETLVDGLFGVRYNGKFSDRWGAHVRGDLATGGTELTWNVLAMLTVQFGSTGKYSAVFGYRQMEIEIEDSDQGTVTTTEMTMAGPLAAFVIRF